MQPQGIWGISRDFSRLSPCGGQVAYALLTRAPVAGRSVAAPPLPLDLHVLSLPLAFILSQDQTLRCCYMFFSFFLSGCRRSAPPPDTGKMGRRSRSRPNRQGEAPEKGAFPRSSLFYSSRRMMSMCQARSRKREGTAKLARKARPCKSRADFFRQGPKKSAFRRLRLQRYCPQPFLSKFYPNFF